jgi:hypothetical protein
MSGVTHTGGVLGATVLGSHAAGILPFTGAAVGLYAVVALGLVVAGAVMTLLGRNRAR